VRLDPGWLRAGMRLLRDRGDGAGPQSERRRDRQPGLPVRHPPCPPGGARGEQRGLHGNGGAAAQLRRDAEVGPAARRPARDGDVRAADHHLDHEGLHVRLAVSLHAPNDAIRSSIMPINRRYPLAEVLAAAREYAAETDRRVSFEYVMLGGVNDAPEHAAELARVLRTALPPALLHVNLIPYNPTAAGFASSSAASIRQFADVLRANGVRVTVRASRGRDIAAACG